MACGNDVMEQERRYLNALQGASRVEKNADEIVLTGDAGTIEFRAP
jgi:heat shock protein HslJ